MKLAFGAKVHYTDGPFGELADVAIDPRWRRVTHLVVAPHHQHARARLVPVDDASVEDGEIMIACTLHDAGRRAGDVAPVERELVVGGWHEEHGLAVIAGDPGSTVRSIRVK